MSVPKSLPTKIKERVKQLSDGEVQLLAALDNINRTLRSSQFLTRYQNLYLDYIRSRLNKLLWLVGAGVAVILTSFVLWVTLAFGLIQY